MKIKYLVNLTTDATDLLAFFEGVETPEQLVSRLERLKRGNSESGTPLREDLLACIVGARASVKDVWEDTIEPSGSLDEDEDKDDEDNSIDSFLAQFGDEETPSPNPASEEETPKSNPQDGEETPGSTSDS